MTSPYVLNTLLQCHTSKVPHLLHVQVTVVGVVQVISRHHLVLHLVLVERI